MELYNEGIGCSKCGEKVAITNTHYPAVEEYKPSWYSPLGARPGVPEYIERSCGHCGYEWKVKPLDMDMVGE